MNRFSLTSKSLLAAALAATAFGAFAQGVTTTTTKKSESTVEAPVLKTAAPKVTKTVKHQAKVHQETTASADKPATVVKSDVKTKTDIDKSGTTVSTSTTATTK